MSTGDILGQRSYNNTRLIMDRFISDIELVDQAIAEICRTHRHLPGTRTPAQVLRTYKNRTLNAGLRALFYICESSPAPDIRTLADLAAVVHIAITGIHPRRCP